uniref:Uncharacterized protein n=1 Tax=Anguilla anguilla TaxID=7936 RepID=A0A0E9PMX9_ANGAN
MLYTDERPIFKCSSTLSSDPRIIIGRLWRRNC